MIKTVALNFFVFIFFIFFKVGTHRVQTAGLELTEIHPPLPPECRG